jgi:predicted nucleic acid-binding protein
MTLVVDASVALRWLFQQDGSDRAQVILGSSDPLIAPDLVLYEITNAAWRLTAAKTVPLDAASAAVALAPKQFDDLVPATTLTDRAFAIAVELRHPAYDCFYLALAEKRACRLVTADLRLLRRCHATRFAPLVTAL